MLNIALLENSHNNGNIKPPNYRRKLRSRKKKALLWSPIHSTPKVEIMRLMRAYYPVLIVVSGQHRKSIVIQFTNCEWNVGKEERCL